MSISVLSLKNVSFKYNSVNILTDISFEAERGDYIGLVGPNGSGKSTLVKIILTLLKPSNGDISLFGSELKDFKDWQKIGYLPQRLNPLMLNFPATVKEIVSLGLISKKRFVKRITKSDNEALQESLALLGIIDIQNKSIGNLSGGQQQRVFLAKALINNPQLLILDEPSTALDPETREKFYYLIEELNKKINSTIIFITHDIGSMGRYVTKLMYLDKKIVFYGSLKDFCQSSDMARYFGDSSQHIICHMHK